MKFNIIYVEKKIRDYENTKKILSRIKFKKIIYCENYSQIFNPKNQNFRIQKTNPSLILAKKENNLILKTPTKFSIGYDKNFYFSHMLNCIYDCKYCFLQGMFNSAHYVIFVNYSDFIKVIRKLTSNTKETICFFSGYDCDSLAMEKITNFLDFFLVEFQKIKKGILEIRTKSVKINIFRKFRPINNVIIAYSLNPSEIIERFEDKTPKLQERIKSLAQLQKLGWSIGLRFDPLITINKNYNYYKSFFELVFDNLDTNKIHSVTIGEFRMPKQFFNKFSSLRPYESFLFKNLIEDSEIEKSRKLEIFEKEIRKYVSKKKIFQN